MVYRRILVTALLAVLCGCAAPKKITTEKPPPQLAAPTTPKPVPAPVPSPAPVPVPMGLPPVPASAHDAPLHISVAYPVPNQWRPNVDSNFIFGTVGNGNASLSIDGFSVPVAKNGAFLAFLPMPENGTYHLVAQHGMDRDSITVAYSARTLEETPKKNSPDKNFSPKFAFITKGSDTLQNGNDVACGALTPDGNREWFFPLGTRLHLVEHEGKYYKAKLDSTTFAWIADSNFDTKKSTSHIILLNRPVAGRADIFPATEYINLLIPSSYNPFQINTTAFSVRIHVYGGTLPGSFISSGNDPLMNGWSYDTVPGGIEYTILLTKPVWGYKVYYSEDGSINIRIRRPPVIDSSNPLIGIRIMLDPGHPPGGATGPTGMMEREANLAEALKLRDQLTAKGAIVLMTHETLSGLVSDVNQTEELEARSLLGVQSNVDLYLSVHNNAFPDGTDPFLKYGTSTYYFHPFSAQFAIDLDKEIVAVTRIPDLGAKFKSLAVCRPTWMPCALTESLYMMFPDQEAALRNPDFLDKLAAAHVRGIEDFLRERAQ